jgi:hypothetical protein
VRPGGRGRARTGRLGPRLPAVRLPAAEEQFRKARFGYFASLVYPQARDLAVYAKWIAWLFLFDDRFDEDEGRDPAALAGERADAAEGIARFLPPGHLPPATPRSALTAALVDLWPELATTMPDDLQERFRRHADVYGASYARPIARARHTSAPELSAYITLRRDSGAVETCLDLVEREPAACLPPAVARSEQVAELRRTANDIICWTNDIASLAKEMRLGELNNIVAVLRGATDMGWHAAVEIAARMIDVRTQEFDEHCGTWLDGATAGPRAAFADGVKDWIAGSFAWHYQSARYAGSPA